MIEYAVNGSFSSSLQNKVGIPRIINILSGMNSSFSTRTAAPGAFFAFHTSLYHPFGGADMRNVDLEESWVFLHSIYSLILLCLNPWWWSRERSHGLVIWRSGKTIQETVTKQYLPFRYMPLQIFIPLFIPRWLRSEPIRSKRQSSLPRTYKMKRLELYFSKFGTLLEECRRSKIVKLTSNF